MIILQKLTSIFNYFTEMSKLSPVIAGVVSLYGLGVITFLFRNIPSSVYKFIKQQVTTTLTLNNSDAVFYDFLAWADSKKVEALVRNYNFTNGFRYSGNKASMRVGYGTTFLNFGGKILTLNRYQISSNQTFESKEMLTVTVFGRSNKIFIKIFEDIDKDNRKDNLYTLVYTWKDNDWVKTAKIFKRNLDTVIIPEETKNKLLEHITQFYAHKNWHAKNGVPYRTGILLEGPPGTGKTSLIKALCAHFDKPLYLIEVNSISDIGLKEALSSVPEGSIVAMEEIDTASKNREAKESKSETNLIKPTLSGLLNSLDGLICGEGRIVLATTNYPKKLDPALVREGRFNLKLHIGYMTDETLKVYLGRFYKNIKNLSSWKIRNKIPPCKVQKLVFDNKEDYIKVLEKVARKNKI